MPLTTLDPNCALIVIDLQHGIVSLPTLHPADEIVARAAQLADAFRSHGLPVVLVNVEGAARGRSDIPARSSSAKDWSVLVDALSPVTSDILITKHCWGAFTTTDLDAMLRARGVTQVILVGIATSLRGESSALSDHELRYNVVSALDAITDLNVESHQHTISRIFPRLGETTTSAELLTRLEQDREHGARA